MRKDKLSTSSFIYETFSSKWCKHSMVLRTVNRYTCEMFTIKLLYKYFTLSWFQEKSFTVIVCIDLFKFLYLTHWSDNIHAYSVKIIALQFHYLILSHNWSQTASFSKWKTMPLLIYTFSFWLFISFLYLDFLRQQFYPQFSLIDFRSSIRQWDCFLLLCKFKVQFAWVDSEIDWENNVYLS